MRLYADFIQQYAGSFLGCTTSLATRLVSHINADAEAAEHYTRVKPGKGGGVMATPFSVGYLMVAVAAGGPRSSTAATAWRYWHLKREPAPGRFELFGDVLDAILDDPTKAEEVARVEVYRGVPEARVCWREGRTDRFTENDAEAAAAEGTARALTVYPGPVLFELSQRLRAAHAEGGRA